MWLALLVANVDNHIKSVADCLTKFGACVDDRVVVEMTGRKLYAEADGITIRIERAGT